MSPEYVPLTEELYGDWDQFCQESDDAWFLHTTDFLELTLEQRPDLNCESKSFMIMQNQEVLGIFPLVMETVDYSGCRIKEFSYGGFHCLTPALSNELSPTKRNRLLKDGFRHVDDLAHKSDIAKVSFRFSPLAPAFLESGHHANNYLLRYGFSDTSLTTQLLDLSPSLDTIFRGMAEGHRRNIRRGEQSLECVAYAQGSVTKKDFDHYVEIHDKAAGRRTRPLSSFELQYRWIEEGKGVLFGARLDEHFVGFLYLDIYKNGAYFGSSCNDPEQSSISISHVLHWQAIQWLRERGYKCYELGWQQYGAQHHDFPSKKDTDISLFKRGFGGQPVPLYSGEKYYSAEYYRLIAADRIEKYADTVEQSMRARSTGTDQGQVASP